MAERGSPRTASIYTRGWAAGAGGQPIDPALEPDADWMRGWRDGRAAFRAAAQAERDRLGLGPAAVVTVASSGAAEPPTELAEEVAPGDVAASLSCATCGRVASCVGRREGAPREEPACNRCCGHGGEDGACRPVVGGFYVLCLKEPRDRMGLLWWRPGRTGYTVSLEHAGVYTADEAYEICRSPADCAAIPVAHARSASWAVVNDQLLQAVLAARADRQDDVAARRPLTRLRGRHPTE